MATVLRGKERRERGGDGNSAEGKGEKREKEGMATVLRGKERRERGGDGNSAEGKGEKREKEGMATVLRGKESRLPQGDIYTPMLGRHKKNMSDYRATVDGLSSES